MAEKWKRPVLFSDGQTDNCSELIKKPSERVTYFFWINLNNLKKLLKSLEKVPRSLNKYTYILA